jgi:hypothetical protein
VQSRRAGDWPQSVKISLEVLEGGSGTETKDLFMAAATGEMEPPIKDRGHRKYKVSASADKWKLVDPKTVTLEDGQKEQVELELKPLPWVEFRVVEVEVPAAGTVSGSASKKEKLVPGVSIKLNVPGKPKKPNEPNEVIATTETVSRIDVTAESGTCEILWMTHEDETWDVLEVKSE